MLVVAFPLLSGSLLGHDFILSMWFPFNFWSLSHLKDMLVNLGLNVLNASTSWQSDGV